MNLWLIFLTGLTTGGLTCLALQGGLLATAIASQKDVSDGTNQKDAQDGASANTGLRSTIMPTVIFLAAKITAYTVVGLFLGWFGSIFQLSIMTQVIIQFAVGAFMIATALRMLDVHPLFRYFVLTPPKSVFKFMRNNARSGSYFSPLILGLATVFLPCAATQALEIQAIGSGSAINGALTMFFFTLGTAPLFFVLGSLATKFSQIMQTYVYPVAATLILILGIMAVDNGLTLSGSEFTLKGFWQTATGAPKGQVAAAATTNTGQSQQINMTVYATGYEPNKISAKAGVPITLNLTTNNTQGCSRSMTFPTLRIQKILPATGMTKLELPALAKGKTPFSCSMGMFSGVIEAS